LRCIIKKQIQFQQKYQTEEDGIKKIQSEQEEEIRASQQKQQKEQQGLNSKMEIQRQELDTRLETLVWNSFVSLSKDSPDLLNSKNQE